MLAKEANKVYKWKQKNKYRNTMGEEQGSSYENISKVCQAWNNMLDECRKGNKWGFFL